MLSSTGYPARSIKVTKSDLPRETLKHLCGGVYACMIMHVYLYGSIYIFENGCGCAWCVPEGVSLGASVSLWARIIVVEV